MGMAGAWAVQNFLLFLSLASCGGDAQMAEDRVALVVNLRVDMRKRLFMWELSNNVTWQECKLEAPKQPPTSQDPMVDGGAYFCRFPNIVLHRGANFTINGSSSNGQSFLFGTFLHNIGEEGCAAVNFSCVIYAVHSMNCSWAPGPSAPADVHYHLYFWTSWDQDEVECAQYMLDLAGTAVGCHFAHLAEPSLTESYFFLLNGTSAESDIPFVDFAPLKGVMMGQLQHGRIPPASFPETQEERQTQRRSPGQVRARQIKRWRAKKTKHNPGPGGSPMHGQTQLGQQIDQQVPWEKCLASAGKTDSEPVLIVSLQESAQTPTGV